MRDQNARKRRRAPVLDRNRSPIPNASSRKGDPEASAAEWSQAHVERRRRSGGVAKLAQWKESPQAQLPAALGLSMVKPCFWMVSSKSMVAPSR